MVKNGKTIAVFGEILGPGHCVSNIEEATVIKHSIKSGIQELHEVAIVDRKFFCELIMREKGE